VVEALGIKLEYTPEQLRECVKRLRFMYARLYQPAFRALAHMRAQLTPANQRTVFNVPGPLLNRARPTRQLIGVYTPRLTKVFAKVLRGSNASALRLCVGASEGDGMDTSRRLLRPDRGTRRRPRQLSGSGLQMARCSGRRSRQIVRRRCGGKCAHIDRDSRR
jgi:hypothetical protein